MLEPHLCREEVCRHTSPSLPSFADDPQSVSSQPPRCRLALLVQGLGFRDFAYCLAAQALWKTLSIIETSTTADIEHIAQTGPSINKGKTQDKNNPNRRGHVEIIFNSEEMLLLEQEIDRFKRITVICHMVGSRPNRGLLRDMLQGKFHSQVGGIKEVQLLGKGFYQIVLEDKDSATNLITMSPGQV